VTPDGAGVIGYAARIGLGPFRLPLAQVLVWDASGKALPDRLAIGGSLPAASVGDGVVWQNRRLAVDGLWHGLEPAIPPTLLASDGAGRLEWSCLCPAGWAAVAVDGVTFAGNGYAEKLTLTISPARLPLRELHWGRFIAEAQSLVWIRWRGAAERAWCFHRGRPVDATMPDPGALEWDGHRLQLAPGIRIRSGRLGDGALRRAGPLRWLLPARWRRIEEAKWCSRGVLTDAQGREHTGWAIHEVALFP
jgi:hypothetical protein